MTKHLVWAVALFALACGSPAGPGDQPPPLLQALPRSLTAGEQAAIAANNDFAFRLVKQLATAQSAANIFASPLSVSMALGMVMNGAQAETRDSMAAALGFGTLSQSQINESYRSLIALLLGLDPQVQVSIANSLWGRQGYPIKQSFIDGAKQYFDAEARTIDFAASTAVPTINAWVNDKTRGKIPTIIESIEPSEVLFAINAIYFKGSWRDQFKPAETMPGQFHQATGSAQTVPFMHRELAGPYARGANFRAVDLWYGAGAHTMTVLVPDDGVTVDQVLSGLDRTSWNQLTGSFTEAEVELYLPKFKLEYKRGLVDDLTALGMAIAFGVGPTNFRGIADADLVITRVDHKTYIDINEEGTEAAAVTNVGVGEVSAPVPVVIRADRPFIIALRERLSGTIVFLGRINSIPGA